MTKETGTEIVELSHKELKNTKISKSQVFALEN